MTTEATNKKRELETIRLEYEGKFIDLFHEFEKETGLNIVGVYSVRDSNTMIGRHGKLVTVSLDAEL